MVRSSLVLLGLLVVALCQALPSANSHSRQKRGFRINSASRVAHGYGKRQFNTWDDGALSRESTSEFFTVQSLANLAAENPALIEALIRRFVDTDGDGVISAEELLGHHAQ